MDRRINIGQNISYLRRLHKLNVEELAEELNVSRQTVTKWEKGQSYPDIMNCASLAALFHVNLDDLLFHDEKKTELPIPEKGKHIFGTTVLGEGGEITLPKEARDMFHLKPGDSIMVLGDENPETGGIALIQTDKFLQVAKKLLDTFYREEDE